MPTSKRHPHLLQPEQTLLVVIDMQEPFLRNIYEPERVQKNVCALIAGMNALRVPVFSTMQNSLKLGETIPEVKSLLQRMQAPFEKMTFSCYANLPFATELNRSGRKQILLCGVESHICVSQTAHELLAAGFQVHVAADAISARTEANWRLGLDKMRLAGVIPSSVEMALYEMLQAAGTSEFREILQIIK